MGVLKVELVEARNLVAKDIKLIGKSTSDPYVKLTVGRNKYTSSVVKKNLAPKVRLVDCSRSIYVHMYIYIHTPHPMHMYCDTHTVESDF